MTARKVSMKTILISMILFTFFIQLILPLKNNVAAKVEDNDMNNAEKIISERILNETIWLLSLQRRNGAIVMSPHPTQEKINPYFANLSATALVKSSPDNHEKVKDYMKWYFNHLNMPDRWGLHGTIYDYQLNNSTEEISLNNYDSADSYAATFISLVRAYAEAGGDREFLISHKYEFDVIGGVMVQLMDKDSLTWAKPNYKVKYLMDNSEVFKGLKDLAYLFEHVFGDRTGAKWYDAHAENVRMGIIKHMRYGNEFYYAITSSDKKIANWDKWYPDSTSQLFPVVFEVISPTSVLSKRIYNKFNFSHGRWYNLENKDPFPWVVVGYAASLMDDSARVGVFTQKLEAEFISNGRKYPWYNNEAGWYLRINEQILEQNMH